MGRGDGGAQLGSFCLSEPASGSDAFALQTTAKVTEDGNHYILNGSKMCVGLLGGRLALRVLELTITAPRSQVDHQLGRSRNLPHFRQCRPEQGVQGHHLLCRRQGDGHRDCQKGEEGARTEKQRRVEGMRG